jgi:hypothetical protein
MGANGGAVVAAGAEGLPEATVVAGLVLLLGDEELPLLPPQPTAVKPIRAANTAARAAHRPIHSTSAIPPVLAMIVAGRGAGLRNWPAEAPGPADASADVMDRRHLAGGAPVRYHLPAVAGHSEFLPWAAQMARQLSPRRNIGAAGVGFEPPVVINSSVNCCGPVTTVIFGFIDAWSGLLDI